jgi:hypothetical protein
MDFNDQKKKHRDEDKECLNRDYDVNRLGDAPTDCGAYQTLTAHIRSYKNGRKGTCNEHQQ